MKKTISTQAFQTGTVVMMMAAIFMTSNSAKADLPITLETMKAECQLDYVRQEVVGQGYGSAIEALVGSNSLSSEERALQIEVDTLTATANDLIFYACAKVRLAHALKK